ncbi:hypothetical protein IAT40_003779 [Kwoniella sp. CBS 6097]
MKKQRCRYIDTPRGCKYGKKCGFSHDRSSASADSRNAANHRTSQWSNNSSHVMPPNGHCRDYYNEGSCSRGSDCKYAHERTLVKNQSPTEPTPNLATRIAGFNGDSLRGNIDSDWRSGPFKRLIDRLEEGDELTDPAEVYTFVGGLVATTIEDSAWMHQDTQVHLSAIATMSSPLHRCFVQVLNWPNLTTSPVAAYPLSFQRGFIPLFLYLSSSAVINSAIKHYTSALYASLDANVPQWAEKTLRCIKELVEQKHLSSSGAVGSRTFKPTTFLQVFLPLTYVLCGYLATFQKALGQHGQVLSDLVEELPSLFDRWATDMLSANPTFNDNIASHELATRKHLVSEAERVIHRLQQIVDRCQGRITQRPTKILQVVDEKQKQQWRLDPEIRGIELLPTHDELLCSAPPFTPANLPSAPHHLDPGTIQRQLDILFRLLREDTVGPFQSAVKSLLFHLQGKGNPALSALLQRGGGRWRSDDSSDSTDLNIYAGVNFQTLKVVKDELCVVLSLRTPQNAGSSSELRKKLGSGALVGLLMKSLDSDGTDELKVFLGEVKEDVEWRKGHSRVQVNFHSSEVFIAALKFFRAAGSEAEQQQESMVFFEVPGFLLGTLMPFLERLQTMEPSHVPFDQYIAGTTDASVMVSEIEPPRFTRDPAFVYNLDRLVGNSESLRINPTDQTQVKQAQESLLLNSPLDGSQTTALMDAMSPPGTGKSFIGIKHVQVLIDSGISPIYVLAYTNHALDQFLEDIYHQVTHDIVRCGSRSKSELIQSRSLHELTSANPPSIRSALRHELGREYADRKHVENQLENVCLIASFAGQSKMPWEAVAGYLRREYPDHYDELSHIPPTVLAAHRQETKEGWQTQGRKSKFPAPSASPYIWWRDGLDLDLLNRMQSQAVVHKPKTGKSTEKWEAPDPSNYPSYLRELVTAEGDSSTNREDNSDSDSDVSVVSHDLPAFPSHQVTLKNWRRPSSNRHIELLREDGDVWNYSAVERKKIVAHWKDQILNSEVPKLAYLRQIYKGINSRIQSLHNEKKLEVLRRAKIIGCTTNGAANISNLIATAAPRVLIVEEAGECLEAHIVANLVPSIEQLILIGDHLQLRPQIGNYRLSIESKEGKNYRLDESLFESLVNAGLPYSMLQTQRRMRPEISNLIRNHLYPSLVDHESVQNLPALKGLSRNVVFFDHDHAQDRQNTDSSSKTNSFEAEMVCDLVVHFLNQGYQAGDIAVLTPYLGQVKVLKQALQQRRLVVELDDRDARDLAKLSLSDEEEQDEKGTAWTKTFENRSAESLVTLRSVDNFQGEEAKVVILSLVRNSGTGVQENSDKLIIFNRNAIASIGFLKSQSANRANVALSRAKQGMVILGNAGLFASQSPMWKSVLNTLEEQDAVFDHIPLRCEIHPDYEFGKVQKPGSIALVSPDGGCLAHCKVELRCGHTCPRLCHPADRQHNNVKCIEPCSVGLSCSGDPQRPHVCKALCGEPHVCDVVIASLSLPCGHEATEVPCAAAQHPAQIACAVTVESKLPCGHPIQVRCGESTSNIWCKQVCGMQLDCKHATCKVPCGTCRPPSFFSQDPVPQVHHAHHPCDKQLPCGHSCTGICQIDLAAGACAPCKMSCERACDHATCKHECGIRECRSCLEDCSWYCVHQGPCQNLCSMPCARLPCDEPCQNLLDCGHTCPSVCGEDCSRQICSHCANSDQQASVVDLLMMTTLAEVDPSGSGLDCRLITLACGHTFTVETIDGQLGLDRFYTKAGDVWTGLANPQVEASGKHSSNVSCPHCRMPILSTVTRRYGRAWKHQDLLNQEQAAMNRGAQALGDLTKKQNAINLQGLESMIESFSFKSPPAPSKKPTLASLVKQLEDHLTKDVILTPSSYIHNLSMFGITGIVAQNWEAVTSGIVPLFEIAKDIVESKSSHVKAYEATHAKHYRSFKSQVMKRAMEEQAVDLKESTVTELALDYAQQQIGSPFPRASSTFKVKAVMLTLDSRLDLLSVCSAFANKLSEGTLTGERRASVIRFDIFMGHFIRCGLRDATACVTHSIDNEAHNQTMLCWLFKVRFQLALSRFSVAMAIRRRTDKNPYDPDETATCVQAESKAALQALGNAVQEFRNPTRGNVLVMRERDLWLKEHFWTIRATLEDEWATVLRMAREGSRYPGLTDAEKQEIKIAMGSGAPVNGGATQWMSCPNGHPYAVGDCGMANQGGNCADCGATIGGGGFHGSRFAEGNNISDVFQELSVARD